MGLLKTAAKVAVAGHVHGKVKRRQSQRWATQDAAAAATPVGAPAADDVLTQLTRLGELRAAGVLTDAEFEIQKARILG